LRCYTRSFKQNDLVEPVFADLKSANKSALRLNILFVAAFLLGAQGNAQSTASSHVWVGTWAAAQQTPEPENALSSADLTDATVRQIFHLSTGGMTLRLHLSNAFGTEPLHFTSVHIACPLSASSAAIEPESDRALSFSGRGDVIVPAGAEYISDAIDYPVTAGSNLAVTFHLDVPPAGQTGHPGSRETSYYIHGDLVSAADLPGAKMVDHWYQVSGIDVLGPADAASVVVLGDSITDGHASTTNGNDRWTDVLAGRLQASAATRDIGVLNEGIGGNHLLTDGLGPNALARFDRDVLAQAGVRWLIVSEGVNDLGGLTRNGDVSPAEHTQLVERILGAYQQIIARAHEHGIRVIGATITPYMGSDYYHPDASDEQDRQAVNAWIRATGHFDAAIDFDKVVRDPQEADRLRPAYDCGDHLHPSPAGYRAMGEAVPLALFAGRR
jgi:lysophospholipase L1-like esterase